MDLRQRAAVWIRSWPRAYAFVLSLTFEVAHAQLGAAIQNANECKIAQLLTGSANRNLSAAVQVSRDRQCACGDQTALTQALWVGVKSGSGIVRETLESAAPEIRRLVQRAAVRPAQPQRQRTHTHTSQPSYATAGRRLFPSRTGSTCRSASPSSATARARWRVATARRLWRCRRACLPGCLSLTLQLARRQSAFAAFRSRWRLL